MLCRHRRGKIASAFDDLGPEFLGVQLQLGFRKEHFLFFPDVVSHRVAKLCEPVLVLITGGFELLEFRDQIFHRLVILIRQRDEIFAFLFHFITERDLVILCVLVILILVRKLSCRDLLSLIGVQCDDLLQVAVLLKRRVKQFLFDGRVEVEFMEACSSSEADWCCLNNARTFS
jgi:hypothetical protein